MRLLASVPVAAVLVVGGLTVTGCGLLEEGQCDDGEHPVYAQTNATGGQCVSDGDAPPEGFAEYPDKRVPETVGDQYDRWPLAEDYPWADEVDPAVREEAARLQAEQ